MGWTVNEGRFALQKGVLRINSPEAWRIKFPEADIIGGISSRPFAFSNSNKDSARFRLFEESSF